MSSDPGGTLNRTMKFSWKALLLAPLPIPLLYSAALMILTSGKFAILWFFFWSAVSSVFSYGTTVFLLLPCLFLISRLTPLTARLTCLMGTVLGGMAYLPVAWVMWTTSGVDSGPPPDSFVQNLWRQLFEGFFWAFIVGGLVTAMLYWFLANPKVPRERATL
jgi:hypothetical protein